jgi:tight adherence protein C
MDLDSLPFGLKPIDLATILVAVAVLAAMVAIWASTTVRDPMKDRLKALNLRRDQLKAGITSSRKRGAPVLRKAETVDLMRDILSKFKVLQAEQTKAASELLMKAGWRSKDAIVTYLFARLVAPLIVGVVACICVFGFDMLEAQPPLVRLAACIGSILLAYAAPDIFVKNAIQKRTDLIRKGLPDGLDLLVICAEAGLTADAAFTRVARELGNAYPELADEFMLTSIELGFLQDRRVAIENLSKRVDLQAMRSVTTTLTQSERYGTPLAASLRVLSAEFRHERMMRAEEKAARLPAIMTVPLILFILPTLFVVILGPAACTMSDEFVNG